MKKIFFVIVALFSSNVAFADNDVDALLNKVSLTLHTEQWVNAKNALVRVSIDASVAEQGIEKIQANVLQKLNQLADKGDWHLVSYDRQQDKSGLENVHLLAEARLPQTALTTLRQTAKSMSKAGETFAIESIQFTPSEDEINQANVAMRTNLYQQAKAEIDLLNKAYPDQRFYLHQIDFTIAMPPQPPMPMMATTVAMARIQAPVRALPIGNKMQMQANVVIAAMTEIAAQKIIHS